MAQWVLQALREAGVKRVVAVVPSGEERIREAFGPSVQFVEQAEPRGTGHALLEAEGLLKDLEGGILVLPGDAPLVQAATLKRLMDHHSRSKAAVTVLTARGVPVEGLGRVVRRRDGTVGAIVEEHEADEAQRAIPEVNSSVYALRSGDVWPLLKGLTPSRKGEIYLTDLIGRVVANGGEVRALEAEDPWEAFGVNSRAQLARAESVLRGRICEGWMEKGVTILQPATTFIDATASLGQDTVVYPNCHIYGNTTIGRECRIGPNAVVIDSKIGDRCRVLGSVLEGSALEDDVAVGPFSHLRAETHVEAGVHIGNFVEIKKSRLKRGVKVAHFSYLGDAQVGENVNIGAGTITCNFDGVRKWETVIEEGAFIGSDTMLVAPVKVGARAKTGAGSVVTKDIEPDTLAVGVPARAIKKLRKASDGHGLPDSQR